MNRQRPYSQQHLALAPHVVGSSGPTASHQGQHRHLPKGCWKQQILVDQLLSKASVAVLKLKGKPAALRENLWDLQSKPRLESSDLLLAKRACAHNDKKPLGSTQNTNTCLYKEPQIPEAFPYLYIFQSSHKEEIT
ncbi:hypothetical protein Nmel_017484 [Mimus melanotis]